MRYDELTNRFSALLDDMAYNGIDHEKEIEEIKEEIKKLDDDMFALF
jgi:hypothetical protein